MNGDYIYSFAHGDWVPRNRDGQRGATRRVEAHQNDTVGTEPLDEEPSDEEETGDVTESPNEETSDEEETVDVTENHMSPTIHRNHAQEQQRYTPSTEGRDLAEEQRLITETLLRLTRSTKEEQYVSYVGFELLS
ncbi:hypothetical protein PG994_006932 [Apiospora phragmitis]|uniref:Uncharacterized protein n=1 Tax=Apiospora phragmitis TaxID=2905665 RepID=A0ABR1VGF1_9PEZI